jgi:hypothetical protein
MKTASRASSFCHATSLADGLFVAERLRRAAADAVILWGGSSATLRLSLSIGVAVYPR